MAVILFFLQSHQQVVVVVLVTDLQGQLVGLVAVAVQLGLQQLLRVVLALQDKVLLVGEAVVQALIMLVVVEVAQVLLGQTHQALMVVMEEMVLHLQLQALA
jgi:hypothetical protein